MRKSENPEMKRRPFIWQHVTFANVFFFFFFRLTFIQRRRAGPIPTVTRHHWKSNIAQRGATAQMRSGTDISDFLFHFCSPSASPPAATHPTLHSHPPTLWRPRKWFPVSVPMFEEGELCMPALSVLDDECRGGLWGGHGDSPWPIISAGDRVHAGTSAAERWK